MSRAFHRYICRFRWKLLGTALRSEPRFRGGSEPRFGEILAGSCNYGGMHFHHVCARLQGLPLQGFQHACSLYLCLELAIGICCVNCKYACLCFISPFQKVKCIPMVPCSGSLELYPICGTFHCLIEPGPGLTVQFPALQGLSDPNNVAL